MFVCLTLNLQNLTEINTRRQFHDKCHIGGLVPLTSLFDTIPRPVRSTFVRQKLGALLQNGPYSRELLWTLQVYLDSNGQVREAAKRLYVHRNTLAYRLERLQDLLGCDFKELDTIIDLRLALEFYHEGVDAEGREDDA